MHVPGNILSAGLQVSDIGCRLEYLGNVEQVELNPRLAGHCWQMQRCIGRTTSGSNNARSIFESSTGADISRTQIARQQLHHLLACGNRHFLARFVGCRRHVAVWQRQTNRLTHTGHCVRGELASTRSVTRTCDFFERDQLSQWAVARCVLTYRFKHVFHGHILAVKHSGQDRAAIDEDGRDIEPQHRHHHAGKAFIAAGEADQRVIAMPAHGKFD